MSLQVWLPLNGDLQNKGLANIRIVSGTATFKNNGKTGNKCLDLHTCNRFYCQKLANKKEFSFAFWYKPETSESTVNWNDVIYFYDKNENESVSGNLRLQTSYKNSYILSVHANTSYNMIPNSGGTYGSNTLLSSSTATRDKWYHVVITLSEDKGLHAYINGELKWIVAHNGGHITGYFNLGQIGSSGNEEGSMNDLRIFDHTLSLKEIKELSKGLVLHYPLDNNGLGYDDTTIYDCSGYQNNGIISGSYQYKENSAKYSCSTYLQKNTTITHPCPVESGINQQWTCMAWVKLDNISQSHQKLNNFNLGNQIVFSSNSYPILYLNSGSTTNDYYNYGNKIIEPNRWTHIAFVFKNSTGTKLIYMDGKNQTNMNGPNKSSTPFGIPNTITVGENLAGQISDYRIYATALSEDDIKELYSVRASGDRDSNFYSSGKFIEQNNLSKIYHNGINNYNSYIEFDSINSNIMPNSVNMGYGSANVSTGTWRNAGSNTMTKSRVLIEDSPIGKCYGFQNEGIQTPNDGSCYGIDSFPLQANTQYTISMWARIIEGTEGYAGFNIYNISSQDGGSHNGTIMKNYRVTALNPNKEWTRCWYTFTTNSSTTRNIYIGITTGETSVTTQMCAIKIEKGLIVTPWKPKEEDENYNQYFTNRININRQKNIFSNSFIEN